MKSKNLLIILASLLVLALVFLLFMRGAGPNRTLLERVDSSQTVSSNTPSYGRARQSSTGSQLFINASQNRHGNTDAIGKELLGTIHYAQINLADDHIDQIGQKSADRDQFNAVFTSMQRAKNIIIGTPVYWSDMSGYLKTLFDRMGEHEDGSLKGKNVYLLIQGSDPTDAIRPIMHVVRHLARTFQMNFVGEATSRSEVASLHRKLLQNSR